MTQPNLPPFKQIIHKPYHLPSWIVHIPSHTSSSTVFIYDSPNSCIASVSLPPNTPYVHVSSPLAQFVILEYSYEPPTTNH